MNSSRLVCGLSICLVSVTGFLLQPVHAENQPGKRTASRVSYQEASPAQQSTPTVPNSSEFIFSAPPREDVEDGGKLYGPIAEYLSGVTGKKIVYKHPGSWGVYQGTMQHGGYDLVFDGPHFNGWRVSKIQHTMLVKIPGDFVFAVVVKKDNTRINNVKQLAGYTVCAHAPPNLGTLTLLEQFDNPARLPVIISTDGWKNIYDGIHGGKCAAAILPTAKLEQFEGNGNKTRIVFRSKVLPDNAFSAGPRLGMDIKGLIVKALLSPEADSATLALRQKYASGKSFVQATNEEYADLGILLRNEWGYY